MDNQVNQHIEMPQIQFSDKVADDSLAVQRQVSPRTTETKHRIFKLTVNIFNERFFKLIGLAHEITGVKVAQKKGKQTVSLKLAKKEKKTWHKLLDDDSTKEVVADDTASSNTNFTSRVNQTTLSDFSKNLGGNLLTQRTRRRRLTIRHAAWILTRYNARKITGLIFVQTLKHCSFRTRS